MLIRFMTLEDLPRVLAIEQATEVAPWGNEIFIDSLKVYSCWVLEEKKDIIGFGIISIKQSVGESHIIKIGVRPDFQGKGFGRVLLQHLLECAELGHGNLVILEVRASNSRAINLYKYFGFNEIGVRKNYYRTSLGREDAIIFGLELIKHNDVKQENG